MVPLRGQTVWWGSARVHRCEPTGCRQQPNHCAAPLCRRFLDQERHEIEYTLRVLQQQASPYKM